MMRTPSRRRVATLVAAVLSLAAWPASSQTQAGPFTLAGTSWRLVAVQAGADSPLIPSDETSYTLDFQADGRLRARIDCNGGRGRWSSPEPGAIQFGPLGLTRETCKPGSLHDRLVNDWRSIRSYAIKAHHLFLVSNAGRATYQFRPLPPKEPVTKAVASVGPVVFDCAEEGGTASTVEVTFYETTPAMVLVERDGRARPAFSVPAASGALYTAGELAFRDQGRQASLTWSGVTLGCQRRGSGPARRDR